MRTAARNEPIAVVESLDVAAQARQALVALQRQPQSHPMLAQPCIAEIVASNAVKGIPAGPDFRPSGGISGMLNLVDFFIQFC